MYEINAGSKLLQIRFKGPRTGNNSGFMNFPPLEVPYQVAAFESFREYQIQAPVRGIREYVQFLCDFRLSLRTEIVRSSAKCIVLAVQLIVAGIV